MLSAQTGPIQGYRRLRRRTPTPRSGPPSTSARSWATACRLPTLLPRMPPWPPPVCPRFLTPRPTRSFPTMATGSSISMISTSRWSSLQFGAPPRPGVVRVPA